MYGVYLDSDSNKLKTRTKTTRQSEKCEHLLVWFFFLNDIQELLLSISGCDNGVMVLYIYIYNHIYYIYIYI